MAIHISVRPNSSFRHGGRFFPVSRIGEPAISGQHDRHDTCATCHGPDLIKARLDRPAQYEFGYFLDQSLHFDMWIRARDRIKQELSEQRLNRKKITVSFFNTPIPVPRLYRLRANQMFFDLDDAELSNWRYGNIIVEFSIRNRCSLFHAWDCLMEARFSEDNARILLLTTDRKSYRPSIEHNWKCDSTTHRGHFSLDSALPDTVYIDESLSLNDPWWGPINQVYAEGRRTEKAPFSECRDRQLLI